MEFVIRNDNLNLASVDTLKMIGKNWDLRDKGTSRLLCNVNPCSCKVCVFMSQPWVWAATERASANGSHPREVPPD